MSQKLIKSEGANNKSSNSRFNRSKYSTLSTKSGSTRRSSSSESHGFVYGHIYFVDIIFETTSLRILNMLGFAGLVRIPNAERKPKRDQ